MKRLNGTGTVWVDDVRCEEGVSRKEDKSYYYHTDYLGSPRVMTDAAGLVTWRQDYYAFGADYSLSATGNTHKFTGHVQDAATGQYYAKARYFTTQLRRFSQPDPILSGIPEIKRLINPQELNPYIYCLNNPLRYTDPDGKQVFKKTEDLENAGTAATKDPNLQEEADGTTHCNGSVQQVAQKGGNTDYNGLNANAIVNKLSDSKYATTLSEQQAVAYAKAGAVVVAGVKGGAHGHVAVVAPADMTSSGKWGRNVPMIYNVGTNKATGYKSASYGFRSDNQPQYYIRNTDKAGVDNRNTKQQNTIEKIITILKTLL